jgi:hypothetical protein
LNPAAVAAAAAAGEAQDQAAPCEHQNLTPPAVAAAAADVVEASKGLLHWLLVHMMHLLLLLSWTASACDMCHMVAVARGSA